MEDKSLSDGYLPPEQEPDAPTVSGNIAARLFPDKFVEWQTLLIRQRLHDYKNDKSKSDPAIRDLVVGITDIELGAEVIRRTRSGYYDRDDGNGNRIVVGPEDKNHKAIASFLMHSKYLSEDMLREKDFDVNLPRALAEYLCQDTVSSPGKYNKSHCEYQGARDTYFATMHVGTTANSTHFQVSEIHKSIHNSNVVRRYHGWGVITPERLPLLFLKDSAHGSNHCYFGLTHLVEENMNYFPDVAFLKMDKPPNGKALGGRDVAQLASTLTPHILLFSAQ